VFAGGSVLAGVPAGAWTSGSSCGICGQNPPDKTAAEWGDLVRAADPGFAGARPRVQLWHGTGDMTLNYPAELDAEIAQWTDVFAVTDADSTKEMNTPRSGWTRTSYRQGSGPVVLEVNVGQGQQHDLTNQNLWAEVVDFFELDAGATGAGGRHAGGRAGRGGAAAGGAPSASGGRGGAAGTPAAMGGASGAMVKNESLDLPDASGGGCGCRVSREPLDGRALAAVGLVVALLVRRRRPHPA
jgi:MYXO-CTERM domain-containing protein